MVIFKGEKISDTDKTLIRQFVPFVLNMFMSETLHKDIYLTLKFVNPVTLTGQDKTDLEVFKAWMERSGEMRFIITINSDQVQKYTNQLQRLKGVLNCLGHELVHVKQYVKNELKDITPDVCSYKREIYTHYNEHDGNYWFAPWEIEAYGYEQGLYAMFKKRIIEESSNGRTPSSELG